MSGTVMLLSSRPWERSVICRWVKKRFRTPLTFRYLNGVLASRAPGCTTTYVLIAMNEEARRVLHPNGKNLIAVHCHQTEGG